MITKINIKQLRNGEAGIIEKIKWFNREVIKYFGNQMVVREITDKMHGDMATC